MMITGIMAINATGRISVLFASREKRVGGVPNVGSVTAFLGTTELVHHPRPLRGCFFLSGRKKAALSKWLKKCFKFYIKIIVNRFNMLM